MLSLRYAIREVNIEFVSSLSALTLKEGEGEKVSEVRFDKKDVQGMPVIHRMNSLLYQALEAIREREENVRNRPSHGVSETFIDDLVVLNWPDHINENLFLARNNNALSLTGKELRKRMFENGFFLGDVKMVPLLTGAGAARQGKYLFIRENLRSEVLEKITLGLLKKQDAGPVKLNMRETTVNVAKFTAYVGLADTGGSSLQELSEIWNSHKGELVENPAAGIELTADSIVVVPDVKKNLQIKTLGGYMITNETVKGKTVPDVEKDSRIETLGDCNMITNEHENEHKNGKEQKIKVEKLTKKQKANCTDGYGFICPDWSEKFNRLMHCRKTGDDIGENDFRHRAFIVRAPFIKGALIECDFHAFVKEKMEFLGKSGEDATITDIYGNEKKLSDVRIILTASMFKGDKFYSQLADGQQDDKKVWDHYIDEFKKSGMSLIIAGNDSAPTSRTSLNYQFLSSLQPDADELKKLIAFDFKEQTDRIAHLKAPEAGKELEYARKVAEYLEKDAVRNAEPKNEDLPLEEEDGENNEGNSEIGNVNEPPAEGSDYSALLGYLVRRYPKAAYTRTVMEGLAGVTVKSAMDASQGRITVKGDTRISVGDPFVLLNSLVGIKEVRETPLLQSRGWVYAPGMEEHAELLILRNPHVSPFEAVVAKNLNPARDNADFRRAYEKYFGKHSGCVFINGTIASATGGSDHDGDRLKVISNKCAIDLVKKNIKRIYELLEQSTDEEFKVAPQMRTEGKALPIINIRPFSAANKSVSELNSAYWKEVFEAYERSMTSKVGRYSLQAARLAFNRGMLSDTESTGKKIEFLKCMALFCVTIGLDIDAAKAGMAPAEPKIPSLGEAVPLLKFSRYVKNNSSKKNNGIQLYREAMEELPKPQDEASNGWKLPKSHSEDSAGWALPKKFSLESSYEELERWKPLKPWEKPENEKSFADMICEADLHSVAEEDKMKVAVKAADKKINELTRGKSAAKKAMDAADNIRTRRTEISQYLFERYPRSIGLKIEKNILASKDEGIAELRIDGLSLEKDTDVIKLAFMKNSERKKKLQEAIFGKQSAEGFIFDETSIHLAKAVIRWRGALKNLESNSENGNGIVLYGELKEALYKIAEKVDPWQLGLRLLKEKKIADKMFVILFAEKCPRPDQTVERKPGKGEVKENA